MADAQRLLPVPQMPAPTPYPPTEVTDTIRALAQQCAAWNPTPGANGPGARTTEALVCQMVTQPIYNIMGLIDAYPVAFLLIFLAALLGVIYLGILVLDAALNTGRLVNDLLSGRKRERRGDREAGR